MPLYSYLSIPFIAVGGLNETSTRFLNTCIAALLPIAVFFFCKELFKKATIGILAAYLISVSLGLHIVGRHAHEAYLAVFLITCSSIFFIKVLQKITLWNSFFFFLFLLLSLFAYQSSRIFAAYFFIYALIYFIFKKSGKLFLISFLGILLLFLLSDVVNTPTRVKNLLFINNKGFVMKVGDLQGEGGNRFIYNKVTVGINEAMQRYMAFLSPEFYTINGDRNYRFGYPSMNPMTIMQYIFVFIGFYYLFKNKEKWRFFILTLLLVSPLSGSLSWAEVSLTRTLFIFIPSLVIAAYGVVNLIEALHYKLYIAGFLILAEIFFLFYAWDFYFFHYPKRAVAIRYWQSGYSELSSYVQNNYNKFHTFYITRKHGEPYIFLLFYNQYSPVKYQKQARLSAPDEYGFGQVYAFDKYKINVDSPKEEKNVSVIGYPDDFGNEFDQARMKKIIKGREEIFWIYEK
jgi:hypothetical protein